MCGRLRCCVCGCELTVSTAYQINYSLVGWPALVPVSLYVCRTGPCRVASDQAGEALRGAEQLRLLPAA